jgi:EAL domain-containing protein (putative c-di-GMP-specific phosphodiesterase class I)
MAAAEQGCAECAHKLQPLQGPQRLVIWPPLGHTADKLAAQLGERAEQRKQADTDRPSLELAIAAEGDTELLAAIRAGLDSRELEGAQALLVPAEREPDARDLPRVQSLAAMLAGLEGEWLKSMLREDRLTSHFHPIVHAGPEHRIIAHEALVRGVGTDGEEVSAGRVVGTAQAAGITFPMDRAARVSAVERFARQEVPGLLFINFMPSAIYDPAFCLRTTFEAVERHGLDPDRVVFEVTESERVEDQGHLRGILDHYRQAGFRIALDDLGAGFASLNLLHQIRPDFVKLDMDLVRDVDSDTYKAALSEALLGAANKLAVPVIAEGVETAGEADWLTRNGADFLQGFYFYKPGPAPVGA